VSTGAPALRLLQVEHLDAWYGAAQVLFDVSLHVERGEVVALLGRNGAGKSTLLKTIIGLVDRWAGSAVFDGRPLRGLEPYRINQLGLGWVPEDRRIFGGLTVLENLAVGRHAARAGVPAWTVERLFALFPNLAAMPRRRGALMSGGEQQMLTVARTLMGNPRLVMLDEPATGVAPLIVDALARAIGEMKAHGVGVLLSEQNPAFAAAVADRAVVIERGQVLFDGAMQAFADDHALQARVLGA